MKIDYVQKIIECCQKRESILLHDGSMREYNRYHDKIRKCARALIDENRESELLPYLNDDNLFIRYDIAGVLYNSYPEQCTKVWEEISEMTISTGLPRHLVIISLSAQGNLEYGVPKDYP